MIISKDENLTYDYVTFSAWNDLRNKLRKIKTLSHELPHTHTHTHTHTYATIYLALHII